MSDANFHRFNTVPSTDATDVLGRLRALLLGLRDHIGTSARTAADRGTRAERQLATMGRREAARRAVDTVIARSGIHL